MVKFPNFNRQKIKQMVDAELSKRKAQKAEEKAIYDKAYSEKRAEVLAEKAQLKAEKLVRKAQSRAEGWEPKFRRAASSAAEFNRAKLAPAIRTQFKKAISGRRAGPTRPVARDNNNDFFGLGGFGGNSRDNGDMFGIGNTGMNIGLTPERRRKSERRSSGFGVGLKPMRFF